jgi:hypothetical protein
MIMSNRARRDAFMHNCIVSIWKRLLADIRVKTGVSLDAPVDISYEWILNEGPKLDKEVLQYLEGRSDFVRLPDWLMPLWGSFIISDDPQLLKYLRIVLVFCYKAEHEPNDEQLKAAQAAFEETEASVALWEDNFERNCHTYSPLLTSARQIVGQVIYKIDWSDVVPNHGPGGIFPTRLPRDKSRFRTLYRPIIEKYPFDQYYCGIPSFWYKVLVEEDGLLSVEDDILCKLTAVPKDSRGPRLICVHPAEAIWIQQGQRRILENAICKSPVTRGFINFEDQTINGQLALRSSLTRKFCSLDLKDASDRISRRLVRYLFGDFAYDWISCSRASSIQLLDGRVVELKKWAPMGNALTFPIESLVFFSLVHAGIRSIHGETCDEIYVFGDDILFPTRFYDGALYGLVSAGLVPNESKTFKRGSFRESCGVDAYKGVDITPLRIRKWDTRRLEGLVSMQDLAKRLRLAGYWSCSTYIYDMIRHSMEKKFRKKYPKTNNPNCGGLAEYVDEGLVTLRKQQSYRFWSDCQIPGIRTPMVRSRVHTITVGDWYHLQDSLLRIERFYRGYSDVVFWDDSLQEFSFSDRGTEYPIPYRVQLEYGWTQLLI